ncbi:hypothetical protein ACFGOO_07915 [Treponema vincentii]|uniref:hypothetical protein n=1 Tax=Treponema vincentii TaxID=69710 RepID=UPI0035F5C1CB
MKHRTIGLTAALFAALIGTAFLFTACWQGTPAGGSNMPGGGGSGGGNTASSIEGITWKSETAVATITLRLKSGHVKVTSTAAGHTVPDNGTYTVSGDTIQFTGFKLVTYLNREFKYNVEGDTLTLLDGATNIPMFTFKKA